jgi:hypothetical protein
MLNSYSRNSHLTRVARQIYNLKEFSIGDYQILAGQAIQDISLGELLMYVNEVIRSRELFYGEDMEKGFELINEGKLEGEFIKCQR